MVQNCVFAYLGLSIYSFAISNEYLGQEKYKKKTVSIFFLYYNKLPVNDLNYDYIKYFLKCEIHFPALTMLTNPFPVIAMFPPTEPGNWTVKIIFTGDNLLPQGWNFL